MAPRRSNRTAAAHKAMAKPGTTTAGERLRDRTWKRFLRGPDPELLEELYEPGLARALRYDRCCAYFSSSVLAAAARGFAPFIERLISLGEAAPRPAVRLLVNEELQRADVKALTESRDLAVLEKRLLSRFRTPKDALERERLAMLAWLARSGLLDVRVGILTVGQGILHAKFGLIYDQVGDAVVFSGSDNETGAGILAHYENLEVTTSWEDPERLEHYQEEFRRLWAGDQHPHVRTLPLPEAVRLRLIRYAPEEPVFEPLEKDLDRRRAAMLWSFASEAPYLPTGADACDATAMIELWPHQRKVVDEVARAWPEGRLLCDEVGMGKTIQAILVLRRLLAGRGVQRALILVPAGLTEQWQGELREKGGLVVPRLEGTSKLVWPDGAQKRVTGLDEALQQDLLILSRETARTETNRPLLTQGPRWDLVILDEAHAARRARQEEGEYNSATLLLKLLRELQLRQVTRGILLLSATPMQVQPWEPWDLLAVLGEGGRWLSGFPTVRQFYEAVERLDGGDPLPPDEAEAIAHLIGHDDGFPRPQDGSGDGWSSPEELRTRLAFPPAGTQAELATLLRAGSPLQRRMHRNTRRTLEQYYRLGLLDRRPPRRHVEDHRFDFRQEGERKVYEHITSYITRRFEELEQEKAGKGFVMTVYRRRAASSPFALKRSLERRKAGLLQVLQQRAHDFYLESDDAPPALWLEDSPDFELPERVSAALPSSPKEARRELADVERLLEELEGLHADTKLEEFYSILKRITDDGRAALVFSEYTDTVEYLRDHLQPHYEKSLGCFTGGGGQRWDGERWTACSKADITAALDRGELRVLLCSDSASEGLNLQAAAALINYDLPWNPSRVEQRIGRIDRIGQRHDDVLVVNLFLKDSVDDRVYGVLRRRCGMFERFIGPMQPVLAEARRLLVSHGEPEVSGLEDRARRTQRDPFVAATYKDDAADSLAESPPLPITLDRLVEAVEGAAQALGGKVRRASTDRELMTISGLDRRVVRFGTTSAALDRDSSAVPLSLFEPRLQRLRELESRVGGPLPLVIGSREEGPFRVSVAFWLDERGKAKKVETYEQLVKLLAGWDGRRPEPGPWLAARRRAEKDADDLVRKASRQAAERQERALARQTEAATIRLLRELGCYLVALGVDPHNLRQGFKQQLARDIHARARLEDCRRRLGGYPDWPSDIEKEIATFDRQATQADRNARRAGSEVDAALADPRWNAAEESKPAATLDRAEAEA